MTRRGGWTRLGRKRFRYVDARRSCDRRSRAARTHPRSRDSTCVDGRVDLAERRREAAGDGHRRCGQAPVPLPPELSCGAGAREVRSAPALRRGAADASAAGPRSTCGSGPYERDWACAIAVSLVNKAWFRVGSDRTCPRVPHVRDHDADEAPRLGVRRRDRVLLPHEEPQARQAHDRERAARARSRARSCDAENGARLFRFEREGEMVNLTAPMLNEYIGEQLGNGFTAKDFRTWGGTLLAAAELAKQGPAAERERGDARAREGHEEGRERARQHSGGRARVLREPHGRRAVPRGNARSTTSGGRPAVRRG